MKTEINGKIVLVTGANRGIGKAIVETFIQHGARKVYLAVRDISNTDELVANYGDTVVPITVDISIPESVLQLAAEATDVQILVNNAAVITAADLLDEDAEGALEYQLGVNLYGSLRMIRAFTPIIEMNGKGAIVQLNSIASFQNFSDCPTYCVSKAALYSMTQGIKDVLADKGIAVLSVHPGPIDTDMRSDVASDDIAEPASTVSEGIVSALKAGDFHLFPGVLAKEFGAAYKNYAANFIEA